MHIHIYDQKDEKFPVKIAGIHGTNLNDTGANMSCYVLINMLLNYDRHFTI